jgi:2-polyprenyl-3-methyl-5-hydroxy-6-metoxy-1,4-benzoquinol methylase
MNNVTAALQCSLCGQTQLKFKTKRQSVRVFECGACRFLKGRVNDSEDPDGAVSTDPGHFEMLVSSDLEWQQIMSKMLVKRLDFVERAYGVRPESWLEIGPGNGAIGEIVHRQGGYWLGIEIEPQMAERMRSAGKNVLHADFSKSDVQGLIESARSEPGTFDIVFFSQVLEHVNSPSQFLKNAFDCLRPGGIIYVDVPNNDGLTSLLRKWNARSAGFGEIVPPHHLMAYGRATLAHALQNQGFENVMSFGRSYRDNTFGLVHAKMDKSWKMRLVWALTRWPGWGGNLVGIARKPVAA